MTLDMPGPSERPRKWQRIPFSVFERKLSWVSAAPLGTPVVPLV